MNDPGFLFMMGVYGTRPDRETVALMRETGAASVLLLARNIDSPAQTRAYTRELVQRLGRPVLFAVDHEGGWVLRFKAGVTAFPGNAALGAAGDERLARWVGRHMARDLRALGIGLNLAPVIDVVERYNPGIGIRSFGSDPRLVGGMGAAMIRGMQGEGLHACAKHFPGKGAASVDAHVKLPTISLSRRELSAVHLAPFRRAIKERVASVMTSHVRMPAFDKVPATFSRKITHGLLRRDLGFKGVIISDDLCMGAVTEAGPVQSAALDALRAGHDLVIVAHDTNAQRESVELARSMVSVRTSEGGLDPAEVAASVRRVANLLRPRKPAPRPSLKAGRELSELIADKAVSVSTGSLLLPLGKDAGGTLILVPDFKEVRERFTFEGGPAAPMAQVRSLASRLPGSRVAAAPVVTTEVRRLEHAVSGAGSVVFLCFEAMRFAGQKAVLKLLNRKAADKTCACLIRNPWDRGLLSPKMTVVDPKGYRSSQLRAALRRVLGACLLALVLAAFGQGPSPEAAPQAPQAPQAAASSRTVTVSELHDAYISAYEDAERKRVLGLIIATAPKTTRDVQRLFDLFIRFPTPVMRDAVMRSLHQLDPKSAHLEPLFLSYMEEDEPEEVVFGINGAVIIRCAPCLPKLKDFAKLPLQAEDPGDILMLSEKNVWWATYEALCALAEWEGKDSLPLLKRQLKASPRVAEVMARYLWKESLPLIADWTAGSKRAKTQAKWAWKAAVPIQALRETRDPMMKILRSPKADRELRHQVAIKVGMSSTEDEISSLISEYEAAKDTDSRLMLGAAVFSSRSSQAIPLLKNFVRENANPLARAGALGQLRTLLPRPEYRELLDWVSKNDPNPDNKADAIDQLAGKGDTPGVLLVPAP
ncbi:MAG: beta-N-acetylhexosaminidase [Elusimicrobia bacterium]|nr:beta-N-acetylhexosaminidase [Elusimicrobiota bacterium]MBI5882148.1 beta-N-acetylhexosaminidase [Elusimicrobiota bacterium]